MMNLNGSGDEICVVRF